jgi:hypothetical protein
VHDCFVQRIELRVAFSFAAGVHLRAGTKTDQQSGAGAIISQLAIPEPTRELFRQMAVFANPGR